MAAENVPNLTRHPDEIDVEADALAALHAWTALVRRLPSLLCDHRHAGTLEALVAWYEHALGGGEHLDVLPPVEALDALVDALATPTVPEGVGFELSKVRRVVWVAEELVRWRRVLRSAGPGSVPLATASDRLELAIEQARRHICAPQTV